MFLIGNKKKKNMISQKQINQFNQYQNNQRFHPLTCGGGNRTDKDHLDGEGKLKLGEDGMLYCPYCDYKQAYYKVSEILVGYANGEWPLGLY